MPRPPHAAPAIAGMAGRPFSRLSARIKAHTGPLYPLHIGDSYMEPVVGARMQDLTVEEHPGMHRYAPPSGRPELVDAVLERVRNHNGLQVERNGVLVSAGATGALGAAIGMFLAPGEEVLILAPFWPLIRGVVTTFRGVPVEVPFYGLVDNAEAAVEAVAERINERTAALYVSTPSNPTGLVLPADWLQALAELCRRENLWLLSDEVYERYAYTRPHVSIGRYAPERTFTAFSFSKGLGMAGNRVGYLVGPEKAVLEARKVSTHTFYASPNASQLAAHYALLHGDAWVETARVAYQKAGIAAARRLGVPEPEGSTFLFLDVASHLDERGIWGFLEDCLDEGLLLAPGPSFGVDYSTCIRVCFTCVEPEVVEKGVEILARKLGR
jgi:aspartate/methionine/tyrosine aminotransferase